MVKNVKSWDCLSLILQIFEESTFIENGNKESNGC